MTARRHPRLAKRKANSPRPAANGSFCANCVSSDSPMTMESGWNDDGVDVAICSRCSSEAAKCDRPASAFIGRAKFTRVRP